MCVRVKIYVHAWKMYVCGSEHICVKGECIGVKGEYMCARGKIYVHERRMHV